MSGNDSRIKVLSGTNLALLLSVVMSKDMFGADQIDEFLSNAIEEAKDSVMSLKLRHIRHQW